MKIIETTSSSRDGGEAAGSLVTSWKTMRSFAACAVSTALLLKPHAALAEPEVQGPDVQQIVGFIRWGGVVASLVVIVASAIAVRFLRGAVRSASERFPHQRLSLQKVESFARFGVYFATGALALGLSFRINQTVLTLLGGTLAVAVGFALRDLVAAMIAGVIIMFDRPFQVGDRVSFGGEYGDVTAIGLRSVRLQTLDDSTVTIPNNKVLTEVTSCGNYGALDMQVAVNLYIGNEEDIELAEHLAREAMLTSQYVYLHKPVVVVVEQLMQESYIAIHIRVKGYVLDTKYEKAFQTDVTKRTLAAYRRYGIGAPTEVDSGEARERARRKRAKEERPRAHRTGLPDALSLHEPKH